VLARTLPSFAASLTLVVVVVVLTSVLLPAVGSPPVNPLAQGAWEWLGTDRPDGEPASRPADPSAYTITFRPDRTFVAQADCNTAAGTYRRSPPGRLGPLHGLQISIGPATLAACAPGSLSGDYLDELGRAASSLVEGDALQIRLTDGGSMRFRQR
jgi:hypothetical protein